MRSLLRTAVMVGTAVVTASCAAQPKVVTKVDLSLAHAQPLARDAADLSFAVPPQSLGRCVNAPRLELADSDPVPMVGAIDVSSLWVGCAAGAGEEERAVEAFTLRVAIDAEGRVLDARVAEKDPDASPETIACVSARARQFSWPANANGRPYEKHVTAVAYTKVGATSWRMVDAVRRLSEPRRAICGCLRDYPLDRAVEMTAELTLAGDGTAWPHDVKVSDQGPLGVCVAEAIRGEAFATAGGAVRLHYAYHFDPAEAATSAAAASGEKSLPGDEDDPLIAVSAK